MGLGRFFKLERATDAEQWQPGDMAECIVQGDWIMAETGQDSPGPQLSETRIVAKVRVKRCPVRGEVILWLGFARYPEKIFDASFFRKVRPSADEHIAAESAFTGLIRKQPARCPAGEGV